MRILAAAIAIVVAVVPPGSTGAVPKTDPSRGATLADLPRWSWPVAGARAIARPFIAPATPYSSGHRGVDIRAWDAELLAPADGVVSFSGVVVDRPVLSIRHPGGLVSSYEPVSTSLVAGDEVTRGEVVGTIEPGHCSLLCVHVGVRLDGEYVSPLLLLGRVPPSVLLPTRRSRGSRAPPSARREASSPSSPQRRPSCAATRTSPAR